MKLDFEKIYQLYPLKRGKNEGLLICKNTIKTEADYNLLLQSVKAYREHCIKDAIEKSFIQHFSTFMNKNRWRDWIDPDTGTALNPSAVDWDRVWKGTHDEGELSKTDESPD